MDAQTCVRGIPASLPPLAQASESPLEQVSEIPLEKLWETAHHRKTGIRERQMSACAMTPKMFNTMEITNNRIRDGLLCLPPLELVSVVL